ncbi:MAG: four helix bundle protein [Bacteroidota bacterium]|jgi:four helix bundle protein
MRNFRELIIWQKAMDIVIRVYELTALLPRDETYGLKTQLQRAAVSIPSNIAEGCSRNSESDFKRFLEIAIGSAYELETQMTIIGNVNLISKSKVEPILQLLLEEQKMLNSFISSVRERSGKKYKKVI